MPDVPSELLYWLSGLSAPVITGLGLLHLLAFGLLAMWARSDRRRLVGDLESFTRELKSRSVLDRGSSLSDQIDAFLADVRDVLDDPRKESDRAALAQRVRILDEERAYLQSHAFETSYNVCRNMIEAYPLAGVLGTVLAIAAALQLGEDDASRTVSAIVRFFGHSIWATFAGLLAAIVLMFVNSCVETGFGRLAENRLHVRDVVARVKRALSLRQEAGPA